MSLSISNIKRNKSQKVKALGAKFAIEIAKTNNDPMYEKYKRFRDLFWDLKLKIGKKYQRQGIMMARSAMKGQPTSFNKTQTSKSLDALPTK